jgi:hypothetical protein
VNAERVVAACDTAAAASSRQTHVVLTKVFMIKTPHIYSNIKTEAKL